MRAPKALRRIVSRILPVMRGLVVRLIASDRGSEEAARRARWAARKGREDISRKLWQSAIASGVVAVASDPSYSDAYVVLGFACMRAGQVERSRQAFRDGMQVAPLDHRLPAYLGELELEQERWPEAEASYRRAVELEPNEPPWRLNLARSIRKQGRIEEARGLLEDLVKEHPDFSLGLAALGELHYAQGNLSKAEELLGAAIDKDPDLTIAHYKLAGVLMELGRSEEALLEARQAVSLQPDDIGYIDLVHQLEAQREQQ